MAASPATICLTANTDAPPHSASLRAGEERNSAPFLSSPVRVSDWGRCQRAYFTRDDGGGRPHGSNIAVLLGV